MHRYPPELSDAIWSLVKEGCGAPEIKRRIDAGEAGIQLRLEKPIPLRTVQHKMAMLRRARGEPDVDTPVQDLAETTAGELLTFAREQQRKIRQAAKGRSVSPEEARVLKSLATVVKTLAQIQRDGNATKRRVGRLPGQTTAPTPKRLLAMLAQQSEGRRTPATDDGATRRRFHGSFTERNGDAWRVASALAERTLTDRFSTPGRAEIVPDRRGRDRQRRFRVRANTNFLWPATPLVVENPGARPCAAATSAFRAKQKRRNPWFGI